MINPDRLLATFLELVQIDSPSREEGPIAEVIANKLRALGASPRIDELQNVSAKIPGRGAGLHRPPLFLNAHSDNVSPARGIKPIVAGGLIVSDQTTVLGADDLAGVAAILETIETLLEQKLAHVPLEITITTQEEIGMHGAKALDLKGFQAKEGVVVDGPGPVGGIVFAAPSLNLIDAHIIGKAAHSGHAPEAGINALRAAADAISKMKIGRIDAQTTTNIGILRGGSARNAVPANVELVGEARSLSEPKLERATRNMQQALEQSCRAYGAKLELNVTCAYHHYELAQHDPLIERVKDALRAIGCKPRLQRSMGGYDANIWNQRGIKCVAVSVGDELNHTTSEFIPVRELFKTAELVERLTLA